MFLLFAYGRFRSISASTAPTMAIAIIIAAVEAMNIGVLSGDASGVAGVGAAAPTDRPACADEVQ